MKNRLILAAPEFCADILYGGTFRAPDEILYFESGKTKAIVLSILEYERGVAEAGRGIQVLAREGFLKTEDRSNEALILAISQEFGVEEWSVPSYFPQGLATNLAKKGLRMIPESGAFFPKRLVKTAAEVKKIAAVMRLTEESMKMTRDIIRNSTVNSKNYLEYQGKLLTSERLRGEIEGFLKANGCTASNTITASGTDSSQPHHIGRGPIQAGTPVVVDIFPRSDENGYWGDMTRTFVKGTALPVVRRAFDAVKKASETAEKMIRDGVSAAEVHNTAAEVMRSAGFDNGFLENGTPYGFIHGLGHGIGLEIHEAPRVSPLNPGKLSAGNVISNEPGLYHPAWGGIRLEDALCVTRDGSINFYTMEKELEL